jgi:NADH-quinone oxidoreductase subunit L
MHAMMGELDMRKMSGLKRVLPKTRWLMLIGCLALAGFPFFSGFFSKDEIVAAAWAHSRLLGLLLLFTAFLTAFYTFRLYFRVFEGPEVIPPPPKDTGHHTSDPHAHHADVDEHLQSHAHADHGHHNHEPAVMILPLVLLAIGAIIAGYINWPKEGFGEFLGRSPSMMFAYNVASTTYNPTEALVPNSDAIVNPVPFGHEDERDKEIIAREHRTHLMFMVASGLISVLGIWMAYLFHLKDRTRAERAAQRAPQLVWLLDHKYWVDEIYQAAIVEPLRTIGRVLAVFDRFIVDGIVNAVGIIAQLVGVVLRLFTQRGYLQGYALTMLLGIAIILLLIFM